MNTIITILGIAGNIAFGWACLPTAWQTWRARKSVGTPIMLAWNILAACLLFYAYTFLTYMTDPIVYVCGLVEIACYSIVIWFHYFPGRK